MWTSKFYGVFVLIHPTHWLISTQATAAFVRGISAHIARRKEAATLLPGAMAYLLDKVRTKPNKHTGCKTCPVRRGNHFDGAKRAVKL